MLTIRYVNGLDVDGNGYWKALDYVPTPGFTSYFSQGLSVDGYSGGRAWWLFNAGFSEAVDAMPLGAVYGRVVFRCWFRWQNQAGVFFPSDCLFLRFENGPNGIQIGLRMTNTGTVQVMRGGTGRNSAAGATIIGTFSLTYAEWTDIEIRIEFTEGTCRVWKNQTLVVNQTGSMGTGCDRVSFRLEGGGGYMRDHIVIASDDAAGDSQLGPLLVTPVLVSADYSTSSGWTPNGGSSHSDRVKDSVQVAPFVSPDEDTTYLAGSDASGEDLFALAEPDCTAKIVAVAWNLASKALTDAPALQARLLDAAGSRSTIGSVTPLSARYAVQQVILGEQPNGEDWTDRAVFASAWGFRGAGSGTMRVTGAYLEKVLDATGLPFDCGGSSYIV